MLEVCASSGAAALRDSIQSMAEAGLEADTIIELVLAEHGQEWRAEPQRSGAGLWAWLLPPLFLAAGALVVIARTRSRRRPRDPALAERIPDLRDEERLREALHSLEESERPNW
jgi:cytochrome c-type biogenesis protein CcmH/NrfF